MLADANHEMYALLVGSGPKFEPPSTKELLAKLEEMTAETWATVRNELVARLGGAVPIEADVLEAITV